MRALLAQVALPPGSQVATTAPVPGLTAPAVSLISTNLIDVSGWWTMPGTVDGVLAYIKAHPPVGTTAIEADSSGSPNNMAEAVTFATTPTHDYVDPQLMITVSADAGQVAVRADAQATWRPMRSAAETLTAATVTAASAENSGFGGGGLSSSPVALTKPQVRQLADLLNELDTVAPAEHGCPDITTTTTLTFHTATGPVEFTLTGCTDITVTASGAQQPKLQDSAALQNWVNALFGVVQSAPPSTPNPKQPSAAVSNTSAAPNTPTP